MAPALAWEPDAAVARKNRCVIFCPSSIVATTAAAPAVYTKLLVSLCTSKQLAELHVVPMTCCKLNPSSCLVNLVGDRGLGLFAKGDRVGASRIRDDAIMVSAQSVSSHATVFEDSGIPASRSLLATVMLRRIVKVTVDRLRNAGAMSSEWTMLKSAFHVLSQSDFSSFTIESRY